MFRRCTLRTCLLVVAAAGLSTGKPAPAATLTWSNSGTAWNTASNWGGILPGSGDVALFNYGPAYTYQPNLSSGTAVGGLWDTGSGSLTISGSTLTLNSATITGANQGIEMDTGAGALTISAPLALGAAQTWLNNSSSPLAVSGNISNGGNLLTVSGGGSTTISGGLGNGSGGLTMSGANGTLVLSGPNTYTGPTSISAGTLRLGSASALPSATTLTVTAGTLDLNGNNATITNFSGASGGVITDNSAGSGVTTLTVTAVNSAVGSLLKDGPTEKLALVLAYSSASGNGYGGPVPSNNSNTYSGGTTLTSTGSNYMRIALNGTWTGTPGNITSGPYGRGTITVGLSPADRVQFWQGNGGTVLNNFVINVENGLDQGGTFRCDSGTNLTLAGTVTLNLSNIGFRMGTNTGNNSAMNLTGQVTGPSGIDLETTTNTTNVLTVTLSNTSTTALNNYQGNTTVYGGLTSTGSATNVLALAPRTRFPTGRAPATSLSTAPSFSTATAT